MPKEYRYMEVCENGDDITRSEKELNAHKYSVTLHTPEGKIKADNFILTAVNKETGKVFFSARDKRDVTPAISMLVSSIAHAAEVLREIAMKSLNKEEALQAIADINQHLKRIRNGEESE